MKKKITFCVALLMCVCMMLCPLPTIAAEETSGVCGGNVTWSFEETTHTLTISGTGSMDNGPFGREMRWAHLYEKIYYIVIEDGITSICDYAFEGSTRLKEVTIPESVTSIGKSAFERAGLTHIDLHDGITYIGINAFEWSSLEEAAIPAGVTEVSGGLFRKCGKLKKVELHDGITAIRTDAFTDCTALESIVIPDSVVWMEDAFLRCSALTEITLSQSLETIYTACFQDCTALREIHIPDSVTGILNWAFQNCTALETVTIGAGVETITPNAFSGCESLKSFVVNGENATFAGDAQGVLYSKDGTRLVRIPTGFAGAYTVAAGTQIIGRDAANGCSGLTGLTIPDSVTEIEHDAFHDCVGLETLDLGNGVQRILGEAFRGCVRLETVTIPASVTYLDNHAFGFCDGLRVIEFLGDRPYFESFVFGSVSAEAWYPAGNATWEDSFPEDARDILWHPACVGGHSFVDVEAVPPGCTEDGKGASTLCSACGLIRVFPTVIPATGHSYGQWAYITPAGTPGREHKVARTCAVCGDVQTEYAYKLDVSELPQAPADTITPDTGTKDPIALSGVQIMLIVIAGVAVCFVIVEMVLRQKRKRTK